MASSCELKPAGSFLRKAVEAQGDDPHARFMDDTAETVKRASSMASRQHTLHQLLCSLFSTAPLQAPNYNTQGQSLPAVVRRVVLVATSAACIVAVGLFLSVAARDPRAQTLQGGDAGLSRIDVRLLTQGAKGGGSLDEDGARPVPGSPLQWMTSRLPGLTRLWGSAQDGERQLREQFQISGESKRVALLFFGLPRSLKYTLPSIEKQLLRPLRDTGYTPTVFLHTFGGVGVPGAAEEQWRLLKPLQHLVTPQKEFLDRRRGDIQACLDRGTGWINWPEKNQTDNAQNMLCQLKSIEQVGQLWEAHYATLPDDYAAVAFVRPDVLYDSPLPTQVIPNLQEGEVYVPGWGENKGMNDRFALLHPSTAVRWSARLKHAFRQCRIEPIHSETFAGRFADASDLAVKKLPCDFVFFRVRETGDIAEQDEGLPGFTRAKRALAKQKEAVDGAAPQKPKSHSRKPSKASAHVGDAASAPDMSTPTTEWSSSLAVCALMKDEQLPDILEWLGYHRWLGVDKIFLRENGSKVSQHIADAVQPLVAEGWLDLGAWEGQSPEAQQLWYNRCSQSDLAGSLSWILFIDLDEFLVMLDKGEALQQPKLKDFLAARRGAAGLTLQWVMFGSSGIRDRPQPGGPLRHFDKCSEKLSFEMKCLASSEHLCDVPFTKPTFLHACAYKYDPQQPPALWPPVLYGDGRRRALDSKIVSMHSPPEHGPDLRTSTERAAKCRSYAGHLTRADAYDEATWTLPGGPSLVLFHYMTRSFEDFSDRKLSRYAGMYVDEFRARREHAAELQGSVPSDEDLMDELEESLGINGAAAVCGSAVKAEYATRCCPQL